MFLYKVSHYLLAILFKEVGYCQLSNEDLGLEAFCLQQEECMLRETYYSIETLARINGND